MYWNRWALSLNCCGVRWIVTLDVLKCNKINMGCLPGDSWIVTLDVLKYKDRNDKIKILEVE